MDEVLAAKRCQRRLELEAELFGLFAEILPGRPAALGEAAKDPVVERPLRVTEARAARLPSLEGGISASANAAATRFGKPPSASVLMRSPR